MSDREWANRRPLLGLGGAFVLQFAVVCVLGNVATNFSWGLQTSGPAFVWAWLLGGALQLSVALSLGKLFSAYPQAGGCSAVLQRLPHRSLAAFVGFLLLAGYIAAIADDNSGLATTALNVIGVTSPPATQVAVVALLCLAAQTVLCVFSLRLAARVTTVAVVFSFVGILCIVVGLMVLGLRQGPGVFLNSAGTAEHEHLPPFLLMLLIPGWTITGLDALGNLAGDVKNPARNVPRGLLSAALAAFLLGTALIVIPLLATPSLAETAGASSALSFILERRAGADAVALFNALDLIALFFLPVVLLLAASRLFRAQAGDSNRPMARWFSEITRQGVPARATVCFAGIAAILCLAWPIAYPLGTVWPALWALAYGLTIAAALAIAVKGELLAERWRTLHALGTANDLLAVIWSIVLAGLVLLFDAAHAAPLFALLVLVGAIIQFRPAKPRQAPPGLVDPLAE